MKKIFILICLFLSSTVYSADIPVIIKDFQQQTILQGILTSLFMDSNGLFILLKSHTGPIQQQKTKLFIDGVEKEITISEIKLITVISSAPIPIPIPVPPLPPSTIRPVPPFPTLFWGPKPQSKDQLLKGIDGMGVPYQEWASWLKVHPEDLDWMWSEYIKTNSIN